MIMRGCISLNFGGCISRSLNKRALVRYESHKNVLESITSISDSHCIWELRMCINTFAHLCEVLRGREGLVQHRQVSIEEQVVLLMTYPIIRFENINRSPRNMAYKFIINLKMSAKHFLLFLRIAANNLQTKFEQNSKTIFFTGVKKLVDSKTNATNNLTYISRLFSFFNTSHNHGH